MSESAEYIKKNVEISRKAREASRIQKSGLTDHKAKLNSKNFEKLMKQRGISKQSRKELKCSNVQGEPMQIRHARAGEKFVITHGIKGSSGVFVSEKSLGKTPEERINKGALPNGNTAEFETKVELKRDQNVIYGKIAPQRKFEKMDPKQQKRNGGGEQIITDGGYNSGAVCNKDTKYPVPARQAFLKQVSEYKTQNTTNFFRGSNQKSKLDSYLKSNGQSR